MIPPTLNHGCRRSSQSILERLSGQSRLTRPEGEGTNGQLNTIGHKRIASNDLYISGKRCYSDPESCVMVGHLTNNLLNVGENEDH